MGSCEEQEGAAQEAREQRRMPATEAERQGVKGKRGSASPSRGPLFLTRAHLTHLRYSISRLPDPTYTPDFVLLLHLRRFLRKRRARIFCFSSLLTT